MVKLNDKQVLVTDAMIEKAIVDAAAKNKQKIGEFAKEASNIDEIEEQLELDIFKKGEEKPDNATNEIKNAIKTRVQNVRAKLVITEATTDAYKEVISNNEIDSIGDISINEVQKKVSKKLEDYVRANPNATTNVLENISQQRQALTGSEDNSNITRITQEALGGKSIEEVATSSVQARHRALIGINGSKSNVSTETQANLKKVLEEKHRDEIQQLLVAVTQEKDEEKLEKLLETVPQQQREMAYATLEVKHYNEKAKRLKMEDNKQAKYLTFDTGATESVVSKLNQIKDASSENENSTSRVIDNYDNSYKGQDTSVPDNIASPINRLYSTEIVTSNRKNVKINSKDINSGIDKPLVDLAELIDKIGKNS